MFEIKCINFNCSPPIVEPISRQHMYHFLVPSTGYYVCGPFTGRGHYVYQISSNGKTMGSTEKDLERRNRDHFDVPSCNLP
jgi:hypothetical protein